MTRAADLQGVQGLRAAACMMVVGYHALAAGAGEAAAASWPNGSAGVDLFFVISGFVMVRSSRALTLIPGGWRRFAARRLCRVVPLYWLLTSLKLAIVAAMPALTAHTRPVGWDIAASYLFIPARDAAGVIRPVLPVGWTLEFEMLFYVLFALALTCRVRPLWLLAPVLAAIAALGFFRQSGWPAPLFLANGMVMEFVAGMMLADCPMVPRRMAPFMWALSAAALLALPLAGPWRFVVWGLPAAALLAATLARRGDMPGWVLSIGDASYAIYLVHPFVVPAMAHASPWLAAASIPASAVLGLAVNRLVDQPIQHLLKPGSRGALSPRPSLTPVRPASPPPIGPSPEPDGWTGVCPPAPFPHS